MQDPHREQVGSATLDPILKRWSPVGRSGLLPALIEAQERLGWLSQDTLSQIASGLNVPLSEAFGVADFYDHLYTHPVGRLIIRVCDDVPCYLKGSEGIVDAVQKRLKLQPGETSEDGEYTFEIVPCLGQCENAPVLSIGHTVHAQVTAERIEQLVGDRR